MNQDTLYDGITRTGFKRHKDEYDIPAVFNAAMPLARDPRGAFSAANAQRNSWRKYTQYIYTVVRVSFGVRYKPIDRAPRWVQRIIRRIFGTFGFEGDFAFGYGNCVYFNEAPCTATTMDECADEIALLFHELNHIVRQRKHGRRSWMLRYWLNRRFRVAEEADATAAGWLVRNIMQHRRYRGKDATQFEDKMQDNYLIPRTMDCRPYALHYMGHDGNILSDEITVGKTVEHYLKRWR